MHHNVYISQVVLSLGFIWGDLFSLKTKRKKAMSFLADSLPFRDVFVLWLRILGNFRLMPDI